MPEVGDLPSFLHITHSFSYHILKVKSNCTLPSPGLDKETCLIPVPPQQTVDFPQSFSLLTENLILTQLTLHLGFHRLFLLSMCALSPTKNIIYSYRDKFRVDILSISYINVYMRKVPRVQTRVTYMIKLISWVSISSQIMQFSLSNATQCNIKARHNLKMKRLIR